MLGSCLLWFALPQHNQAAARSFKRRNMGRFWKYQIFSYNNSKEKSQKTRRVFPCFLYTYRASEFKPTKKTIKITMTCMPNSDKQLLEEMKYGSYTEKFLLVRKPVGEHRYHKTLLLLWFLGYRIPSSAYFYYMHCCEWECKLPVSPLEYLRTY